MRKGLAILVTLIAILFMDAGVGAQCRVVTRAAVYQAPQQYNNHAYVAPVAAVYAAIPVYSVGYQDNTYNQLLLQEFQLLRLQMLQMQQFAPPPVPAAQPRHVQPMPPASPTVLPRQQSQKSGKISYLASAHPGAAILKRDCLTCHDDATAKAKGRNIVLFSSGALVPMDGDMVSSVLKEIFTGRMPKDTKDPMKDEDVSKVFDLFDTAKSAPQ